MYWILVLSGIPGTTCMTFLLSVSCVYWRKSWAQDQAMKLNACFTSLIWQMIRIWKFKGIVASYQYELTSYERFKYADHTYGVCTVFFRERCKTFSTGTGSLDLYSRIVLDSFRRWKRLFYTLIGFFKQSWDRYLSLILYVFILMMRSRLFHKVSIM